MGPFRYSNEISVVFKNGITDQIAPALLGTLIASKKIDQFERSEGWAELGIDPVRGMGGPGYAGGDRRLN